MTGVRIWRTRVVYLVITIGLWIAIWGLLDNEFAAHVVIGAAVLANMLFALVTMIAPTTEAFEAGERTGKAVGYHNGYRDGFEQGSNLYRPSFEHTAEKEDIT